MTDAVLFIAAMPTLESFDILLHYPIQYLVFRTDLLTLANKNNLLHYFVKDAQEYNTLTRKEADAALPDIMARPMEDITNVTAAVRDQNKISSAKYNMILDPIRAALLAVKIHASVVAVLEVAHNLPALEIRDIIGLFDAEFLQPAVEVIDDEVEKFKNGHNITSIQSLLICFNKLKAWKISGQNPFTNPTAVDALSKALNKIGHNETVCLYHKDRGNTQATEAAFIEYITSAQKWMRHKHTGQTPSQTGIPMLNPIVGTTATDTIADLSKKVNLLTDQISKLMQSKAPAPPKIKFFCSTHGENFTHTSTSCNTKSEKHNPADTLSAWSNKQQHTERAAERAARYTKNT